MLSPEDVVFVIADVGLVVVRDVEVFSEINIIYINYHKSVRWVRWRYLFDCDALYFYFCFEKILTLY